MFGCCTLPDAYCSLLAAFAIVVAVFLLCFFTVRDVRPYGGVAVAATHLQNFQMSLTYAIIAVL